MGRRQQYQERTAADYYGCLNWLWQPIGMPNALVTEHDAPNGIYSESINHLNQGDSRVA